MTKAETTREFLQRVQASGIIDELAVSKAALEDAASVPTPSAAASLLVERHVLTEFQARVLVDDESIPLVIGEYVVTGMLGRGGMGFVLKARHRRMHRDVAIKFLHPEFTASEELRRRFEREVRTAAQLHHQNVVTAYDAGEHSDGSCYLVMQFVSGEDLSKLVKKLGPLSIPKTVDIIRQAAEGLAFAHEKGIVHRDIKPGNLLLDNEGVVRILDLGLARMRPATGDSVDGVTESDLTTTGHVMGTVDFMAPEQALDSKSADERADIYSLGCTLYFLLTGQPPYRRHSMMRSLLAHREDPIPSLCSLSSRVPQELDEILHLMLAKRPEDRFGSMRPLIDSLKSVLLTNLDQEPITHGVSESRQQSDVTVDRADDLNVTRPLPLAREQVADAKPIRAVSSRADSQTTGPTPAGDLTETASFNVDPAFVKNVGTSQDVTTTPSRSKRVLVLFLAVGIAVGGAILLLNGSRNGTDATTRTVVTSPPSTLPSSDDGMSEPADAGGTNPERESQTPLTASKPMQSELPAPIEALTSDEFEWSEPENLGPVINSAGRENSPVLTGDERLMFFGRGLKIWQARRSRADGPFETAEPLPIGANEDLPAAQGLSVTSDGLVLAFTLKQLATAEDIMICTRQSIDEPFGVPQLLPESVNSPQSERVAVLSSDGLSLWFTVAKQGTRSGDIFQFARPTRDVPFTHAVGVGPHLNGNDWDTVDCVTSDGLGLIKFESGATPRCLLHVRGATTEPFGAGREFAPRYVEKGKPFVSADGMRLYFHNRELPGSFGDLDLFVVRRIRKQKQ